MSRLPSVEALRELRERIQDRPQTPSLVVCAGTACQASGANETQRLIKRELLKRDLVDRLSVRITGCHGFCEMGPFILTDPQGALYVKVSDEDVPRIVEAVLNNDYVEDLLYRDPVTGKVCRHQDEIPFYAKQRRTILGRNQTLDPIRLSNYLATGGYSALESVIESRTPESIIDEIKRSGLRGRGGGGFLTGVKWEMMAKQPNRGAKYVVCNADEGDPGAYMDEGILEGNPHSVIEGMIIGAMATGATEGFIFVRSEYPLAIKHMMIALAHARGYGLLGDGILGTDMSFDVSIVRGAGAFVCGEETALVRAVEGRMGEPRQRPPYPVEKGVYGKPTVINNVETWANVPVVLQMGGDEYAKTGTRNSTGTKVFSLVGKVRNTGLVEVEMGATINDIVHEIGGGPPEGGRLKAIQIGGPSGGCIPSWRFDLPIDFHSLQKEGAIMGSGGMIVMDEDTCMVDVAKYFVSFLKDESCGKCFTCRKGIQRMHEILDDITSGRGSLDQLDLLKELSVVVKDSTMCGLGQSAPNPVLSTLRYFGNEYRRHIVDGRCDAFVCRDLVGAPCQSACPVGTEAWRYVAHIAAGEYEQAYLAIREHNPFPSVCSRVCDHQCEMRCRLGGSGKEPVAIRALKRFVTDRVDPSVYKPRYMERAGDQPRVAVVGSGPAGLTAAHHLSLTGHRVTVFEALERPGGMLVAGVPTYRLPREIIEKEIEALLDDNITVECNKALGRDFSADDLLDDGYEAIFLALGAHRCRRLGLEGEDHEGVYPSLDFLKAWNLEGTTLARGRVGVIGGGNSAIDAARGALRQEGVESVDLFYRRTRREMPAFEDEIEEAIEEGVRMHLLMSPVELRIEAGRLTAVDFIKNELGPPDESGRRRPVPIEGSEDSVPLDTLVVAIGEQIQPFAKGMKAPRGVEVARSGAFVVDEDTLMTGRAGVFAGGDAVTGPNTVIEAVAAGRRAARMIDRYLRKEPLVRSSQRSVPSRYLEPTGAEAKELPERAEMPRIEMATRLAGFAEVEGVLSEKAALCEASRCLRCDLEFTRPAADEDQRTAGGIS
jgi:NADH-quinone oxidoreductase subunit F